MSCVSSFDGNMQDRPRVVAIFITGTDFFHEFSVAYTNGLTVYKSTDAAPGDFLYLFYRTVILFFRIGGP